MIGRGLPGDTRGHQGTPQGRTQHHCNITNSPPCHSHRVFICLPTDKRQLSIFCCSPCRLESSEGCVANPQIACFCWCGGSTALISPDNNAELSVLGQHSLIICKCHDNLIKTWQVISYLLGLGLCQQLRWEHVEIRQDQYSLVCSEIVRT